MVAFMSVSVAFCAAALAAVSLSTVVAPTPWCDEAALLQLGIDVEPATMRKVEARAASRDKVRAGPIQLPPVSSALPRSAAAAVLSGIASCRAALRAAATSAAGSPTGALLIVLIVFVAILGIFWVFQETLIPVGSASGSTDPVKPHDAKHAQRARMLPPTAGSVSTGGPSLMRSALPAMTTATSAPTVNSMRVVASAPSAAVSSGPALTSVSALQRSHLAGTPPLAIPERPSFLSNRPSLNPISSAPSPRRMAGLALLRPGMERKLLISDPAMWSHMEAYFRVPIAQMPVESTSTGDFDIIRGVSQETAFRASVVTTPPIGKRVLSLSVPGRDVHLATLSPAPGACSVVGGQVVEPCSALQLRSKDGSVWGTLLSNGEDRYSVHRAGEQLLMLEGNQEEGCLVVFLEGEPIAHAARSDGSKYLEVGVKPSVDPILMLACILAVVIFDPTDVATPVPSSMAMPQTFG